MTSTIRQILKLTISLVLFGLLSGCGAIGGAALSGALMGAAWAPDRSPSPPTILCTAEDSMGLKYYSRTPHMHLIYDNCAMGYVETYRADYLISSIVYVSCLQADGSPAVSPSCKYVAPEQNPVGFGHEDWDSIDR
jgi:hypothetical protein